MDGECYSETRALASPMGLAEVHHLADNTELEMTQPGTQLDNSCPSGSLSVCYIYFIFWGFPGRAGCERSARSALQGTVKDPSRQRIQIPLQTQTSRTFVAHAPNETTCGIVFFRTKTFGKFCENKRTAQPSKHVMLVTHKLRNLYELSVYWQSQLNKCRHLLEQLFH